MYLVAVETISAETLIVDGLDETILYSNENSVELPSMPNATVSSGYETQNCTNRRPLSRNLRNLTLRLTLTNWPS